MSKSFLKNDRLLRALACEPVDKTPIWLMRQAGRYLPEYRALRLKVPDFMTLCKTPDLACEVTLQPLARYDLDAAILFSDILTIPDAMGLGLEFVADAGPRFQRPLRDIRSIKHLPIPDPELTLGYVPAAVRLIKKALEQSVPLIGFSGSPWTLACYMVEGGSSKDFHHIKRLLYTEPLALHSLLHTLSDAIILYCQAQIQAGVDVIMLFDTWGGILNSKAYSAFSLAYMQRIIAALPSVPVILFTKGGGPWLEQIALSGCRAISLDWTLDLEAASKRIPSNIALQGNLDPTILLGSPEAITTEATIILQQASSCHGHIFNLGHGILPATPIEHVQILVDVVHHYNKSV